MCIECYFAKMFYKDNFTLYAFSLVLFMFLNIIGAGLCMSLVNLLLCLSAVLGGSERWLTSGSDIPIECDSILPSLSDNLRCHSWRGFEWRESIYHPYGGQWGGQNMPWPKGSHPESSWIFVETTCCFESFLAKVPKKSSCGWFLGRCETMICGHTILSLLETMEKNHILQG